MLNILKRYWCHLVLAIPAWIFVSLMGWWAYEALTVNLVYRTSLNGPKQVLAPGDMLRVDRYYCINSPMFIQGFPWVEGQELTGLIVPPQQMPMRFAVLRPGCHEITFHIDLPPGMKPGHYTFSSVGRFEVNPIFTLKVRTPDIQFELRDGESHAERKP